MTSRTQENQTVHSQNLRKMLNDIAVQLSTPYVKKRAQNKAHKQSLVEELQDAISYLTDKERELQVSLDISKYLLDSNEVLQSKVDKLKENQDVLCSENQDLLKDIQTLKSRLKKAEEKNEHCGNSLSSAEIQLLKLSLNIREFTEGPDKNVSEDLHESLQHELQLLKSKKKLANLQKSEKKCEKLSSDKERLESTISSSTDQYTFLKNKYKSTLQKLKESQNMQKVLIKANEKLTKKYKNSKSTHDKLLEKIQRLEENLKIETGQVTKASENFPESGSLLLELQQIPSYSSISEDEFFQSPLSIRSNIQHFTYSPSQYLENSAHYFPTLQISVESSVNISPQNSPKCAIEEYFILTTQAIKMNSPHMDQLGNFSHAVLYQRALNEQIPFHRWHLWIENQLNCEYIQSMYHKQKPVGRLRSFFNRF